MSTTKEDTLEQLKARLEQVRNEICEGMCNYQELELLEYDEHCLELEIDRLEEELSCREQRQI